MINPENYRGTDVSYVSICRRRAWLSLHEISITDGTEFVKLGEYENDRERQYGFSQVTIGRNKIDYLKIEKDGKCTIHEFKRGRKVIDADIFQLSHYMKVASDAGFEVSHGEIHLLGSKKIVSLDFPIKNESDLIEKYKTIDQLKESKIPKAEKNFCFHGCSYVEFCWGDI
ncbi:Dna2/Cas4 domain-containing protein [Cuniculiplasma sp. SKW4]|uniref:Dna2/Cas4 domain-containing protein n=1 Tax=Cuniculiplasma sp. SKW4 TaxID=3400171 RepID=UPI003FD628FF